MRNFTIDDYMQLSTGRRLVVDEWLKKYNLVDKAAMIERYESNLDDPLLEPIKLTAWGASDFEVWTEADTEPYQVLENFMEFRKLAEFHFDDFPWYILTESESNDPA